jgi:probable HAF family extracellular repeat protein
VKRASLSVMSIVAVALCAMGAHGANYTVRDLGASLRPVGINKSGQVAGFCMVPPYKAFIWQNDTKTDLPGLGNAETVARGISDDGKIVGYADTSSGVRHAVAWQDGKLQDLGASGACIAVSSTGQIVGSKTGTEALKPEVTVDVGTLGGESIVPSAINASGKIAGAADTGSTYADEKGDRHPYRHAFLSQSAATIDLGTLGGRHSFASGINDSSHIVGCASTSNESMHAFLWKDGKMIDLGTLGGSFSEAKGIDNLGHIVGSAAASDGKAHAFIWENGTMADLNSRIPADSGWALRDAIAINDAGQIVGLGFFDGKLHAFLLTPSSN